MGEEAGCFGEVAAVGDDDLAGLGPGDGGEPLLEDFALAAQDEDAAHILDGGHGEAVVLEPVGVAEVGLFDGLVGIEEGEVILDDLAEGEAGIAGPVGHRGDFLIGLEPGVEAGVVHEVDDVEVGDALGSGLPLEDDFLESLDDEALEEEAAADGVADGLDAADLLEVGPEGDAVGIADGEAGVAVTTIGFGEEVGTERLGKIIVGGSALGSSNHGSNDGRQE